MSNLKSTTPPNVLVTQYINNVDYAAAEKWGAVSFMTSSEHRPEPTMASANDQVLSDVKKAMSLYIMGMDYILLAPSQVINAVVGTQLKPGIHNMLKWDNRERTYRLHKLTIG